MLTHSTIVGFPGMSALLGKYGIVILLICGMCLLVAGPFIFGGRSPHRTHRASDIDVRLSDVRGAGSVMTEVVNTLNLFLGSKTFARDMGGSARRGVLFEGPPGTGKTFMAKAMAGESGVPFLFVNSSAFQSMYHGQTNRKIRAFFRALRKHARAEGGAIGFIEEIDAIAGHRREWAPTDRRDRRRGQRAADPDAVLRRSDQGRPRPSASSSTCSTASCPRRTSSEAARASGPTSWSSEPRTARTTSTQLCCAGAFRPLHHFDPPSRAGRVDILSYYLGKKSHDADLGTDVPSTRLAAMTMGYTPVMLERLLDEALVVALRRGRPRMSWADVADAKLITELGLTAPVDYTELEKRTIATHEAGHCHVAYFVGQSRQLDVLSIKKRRVALGLLQHSDAEERFTTPRASSPRWCRSPWAAWQPKSSTSGKRARAPRVIWPLPRRSPVPWSGPTGWATPSSRTTRPPRAATSSRRCSVRTTAAPRWSGCCASAKERAAALLADQASVVEALRDALLERDELVGSEITDVIDAALAARQGTPEATVLSAAS